MIRITFIDGEYVDVNSSTVLVGFNNLPSENHQEFYLKQVYNSRFDDGLQLTTVDQRMGITGFILSHDCFMVGNDDNNPIYLSTAVKSVSVV